MITAKQNNSLQQLYTYKNYSFNANLLIRDNGVAQTMVVLTIKEMSYLVIGIFDDLGGPLLD